MRLLLKEQIMEFNQLLEKQAELMHSVAKVTPATTSNGSQISPSKSGFLLRECPFVPT